MTLKKINLETQIKKFKILANFHKTRKNLNRIFINSSSNVTNVSELFVLNLNFLQFDEFGILFLKWNEILVSKNTILLIT